MKKAKKNNNEKVLPKLPHEQRASYEAAGKWPPPEGLTILLEAEPSLTEVKELFSNLKVVVTPSQRTIVERAEKQLIESK
ncbi:MAG: hypothetical protein WCE68_08190 [Anaerolineales bacterium]